jgi:hypothetical protein
LRFRFSASLFTLFSASFILLIFKHKGEAMADIDVKQLTGRIDTVLDILVAGDYSSAIRNLEILKAELQQVESAGQEGIPGAPKTPWEV